MPRPNPFGLTGVASEDLSLAGLGRNTMNMGGLGDMLRKQRDDETEEEKRKRRLGLSKLQQTGSLAVQSLCGPGGFGGGSASR